MFVDETGAKPRYANKRTGIWGSVKDWLVQGCLPDDPELAADFTGVEYAASPAPTSPTLTFALPVTAGWGPPPGGVYLAWSW